jgi:drug/metabolite transporter (DMT)-like permease
MGLSALMIPVIAVLVGVAFGGESFGPRDLAGALLVIGGVWLSLAPPRKLLRRGLKRGKGRTEPVERVPIAAVR